MPKGVGYGPRESVRKRVRKEINVGETGDAAMDSLLAQEGARRIGFAGVRAQPRNPFQGLISQITGALKPKKKKNGK